MCCASLRVIAGLRGHSHTGRARSLRGPQDAVNRESAAGGAPEPIKRGHERGGHARYPRGPRNAVNRESAPGGAPEHGGAQRRGLATACGNSASWAGENACRGWRKAGSSVRQRRASGEGVRPPIARPREFAPRPSAGDQPRRAAAAGLQGHVRPRRRGLAPCRRSTARPRAGRPRSSCPGRRVAGAVSQWPRRQRGPRPLRLNCTRGAAPLSRLPGRSGPRPREAPRG